jgi:prepilin-type processing-associated H-X9-DG protein
MSLAQQVDLDDPMDPRLGSTRHQRQVNVLFIDGHVEQIDPTRQELSRIKL